MTVEFREAFLGLPARLKCLGVGDPSRAPFQAGQRAGLQTEKSNRQYHDLGEYSGPHPPSRLPRDHLHLIW